MAVDWGFALMIFVFGFSGVFVCLSVLMITILLVGSVFKRMEKKGASD